MDARLQQRVQRYGWDKAASYYEHFWASQLEPAQNELMRAAHLRPGHRVLELACGTGLVTFRAATAVGAGGEIVATDISDRMIETISAKARSQGISNVHAVRCMAEDMHFPDQSFDVMLCALGLMYVTDPLATLRESLRVLRPGGSAVVAVWGARNKCGWADIFPIVESRVESEVCPLFFQLGTGDALSITLSMAGFSDVTAARINTTLHYASADEACGAAFAGGPVALAWSRFDEQTKADAAADYLRSIAACRVGDGYNIPGEFVIARGMRTA